MWKSSRFVKLNQEIMGGGGGGGGGPHWQITHTVVISYFFLCHTCVKIIIFLSVFCLKEALNWCKSKKNLFNLQHL